MEMKAPDQPLTQIADEINMVIYRMGNNFPYRASVYKQTVLEVLKTLRDQADPNNAEWFEFFNELHRLIKL